MTTEKEGRMFAPVRILAGVVKNALVRMNISAGDSLGVPIFIYNKTVQGQCPADSK